MKPKRPGTKPGEVTDVVAVGCGALAAALGAVVGTGDAVADEVRLDGAHAPPISSMTPKTEANRVDALPGDNRRDSAPTGDYLLDGEAYASAITHIATLDQKVLGEA